MKPSSLTGEQLAKLRTKLTECWSDGKPYDPCSVPRADFLQLLDEIVELRPIAESAKRMREALDQCRVASRVNDREYRIRRTDEIVKAAICYRTFDCANGQHSDSCPAAALTAPAAGASE